MRHKKEQDMDHATETSGAVGLLEHLKSALQLKNDAALAPVGDSFLVKSHEIGGMSFAQLRTFVPAVKP
jgi:hypothetical protein